MGTGELNAGDNPSMDLHPIQGGVEILLVASCYRNRDKLRPDEPLGMYADLTFTYFITCTWQLLQLYMAVLSTFFFISGSRRKEV